LIEYFVEEFCVWSTLSKAKQMIPSIRKYFSISGGQQEG